MRGSEGRGGREERGQMGDIKRREAVGGKRGRGEDRENRHGGEREEKWE